MATDLKIELHENSGTIEVGGRAMHFRQSGSGDKIILAFHGYGNDSSLFKFLKHPDFTVYSFDLPFQGKSFTLDHWVIRKEDLNNLLHHFLKEKAVKKVGLVGFSLGSRFCLCLAEQMPEHISNIVLIAPDGLVHNNFYHFLTKTNIGERLFKSFTHYGSQYLRLFSILNKIKLLSRHKYRFAMQYIMTEESRTLLYKIWMATSPLVPDLGKVRKNIQKRNLPVHLCMGVNDRIIPYKNAVQFKGNSEQIKLHLFERGHNLLHFEEVRGTVEAWLFRTYTSVK